MFAVAQSATFSYVCGVTNTAGHMKLFPRSSHLSFGAYLRFISFDLPLRETHMKLPKPPSVPVDTETEALARRLHAAFVAKTIDLRKGKPLPASGWNDLGSTGKACWYAVAEEARR